MRCRCAGTLVAAQASRAVPACGGRHRLDWGRVRHAPHRRRCRRRRPPRVWPSRRRYGDDGSVASRWRRAHCRAGRAPMVQPLVDRRADRWSPAVRRPRRRGSPAPVETDSHGSASTNTTQPTSPTTAMAGGQRRSAARHTQRRRIGERVVGQDRHARQRDGVAEIERARSARSPPRRRSARHERVATVARRRGRTSRGVLGDVPSPGSCATRRGPG